MGESIVDRRFQFICPAGNFRFLQALVDACLREGAPHFCGDCLQQHGRYASSRNTDTARKFAVLLDWDSRVSGFRIAEGVSA